MVAADSSKFRRAAPSASTSSPINSNSFDEQPHQHSNSFDEQSHQHDSFDEQSHPTTAPSTASTSSPISTATASTSSSSSPINSFDEDSPSNSFVLTECYMAGVLAPFNMDEFEWWGDFFNNRRVAVGAPFDIDSLQSELEDEEFWPFSRLEGAKLDYEQAVQRKLLFQRKF
jgi:hypothetical protein